MIAPGHGHRVRVAQRQDTLTVGVTGITGTVGRGLLPFLEEDARVDRVIGIGSRARDSFAEESPKLDYRQVDVRERLKLRDALSGADVVVHLAFSLYGVRQGDEELDDLNIQGSLNVLDAAAANGARRFIYTSSGAVYGFDGGRPARVDEKAPVAPAPRHFYSRQKARVEEALLADLDRHPELDWIFFRPCAVVGPHAAGAAGHGVPSSVARLASAALTVGTAAGLRPAIPGPPVPLQFVHEDDVGQAIHRAIHSRRSRRIYNLGGDGMVPPSDVPRLVGLRTLPVPRLLTRTAVDTATRLPYIAPAAGWSALLTRPLELDSSRAKRELRWRPRFSSAEALASTRQALAL
jgi:nucleoside-diphosphate-sugar epimerase